MYGFPTADGRFPGLFGDLAFRVCTAVFSFPHNIFINFKINSENQEPARIARLEHSHTKTQTMVC